MKKEYAQPEMEIIEFTHIEVITTSGDVTIEEDIFEGNDGWWNPSGTGN